MRCKYALFMLGIGWLLVGATPASLTCKQRLLQAYHSIALSGQAKSSQVVHMQILMEAYYHQDEQTQEQHASMPMDIYSQGTRMTFTTPSTQVWQDGRYLVTVLTPQKTVLIAKAQLSGDNGQLPSLLTLRDSLIQQGTITYCESSKEMPHTQQIRLQLSPKAVNRVKAQALDFWLNSDTNKLEKLQVTYSPQQSQTRTVISFLKNEYLISTKALPHDARAQVLTAGGGLLPQYAGYRLIDKTKASTSAR